MTTIVPLRILLVEDSTVQARFVEQTLQTMDPAPSRVVWVDSLACALERLDHSIDLVLLDLVLPDSSGIETFRAVHKANPRAPVIVLSGSGDEALALRAVTEGAQDYLFKSTVSPATLARSIAFAMERHRALQLLQSAAIYDDLTGILNRRGFTALADQQLASARRAATAITVLFVDVDGLKQVNDAFGHQCGDLLLGDLAKLMKTTFRASDIVGRVGGDEFCALLLDEPDAQTVAARLRLAIDEHNASGGRPFHLSCSIGKVTTFTSGDLTLGDILAQADQAMYEEKRTSMGRREGRPPHL